MARNLLGSLRSGKDVQSIEDSSSDLTHINKSYKVSSDFDDSKDTEQYSELSRDHVFRDKKLVEHWISIYERVEYEGRNRFDPNLIWTKREEADIVRKLDFRVMLLVWLMFLSLDLIRQNLNRALASKSEKVSGNIFADLNITQNDVNHGLICTYVSFLVMELPSGLISKRIGPEVWIPAQIIGWSIISAAQSAIQNKTGFFFTRVLLGMCQGGFVPDMGLYLTYFYTSKELNTRMSWFYTVLGASQIIGSFLSAGFMSLNGWHGVAGWRYLFAFDSVISGLIGTAAFLLMPGAITHTTTPIIRKPWLNEREQSILVNRLLRDDPSKGDMNNRQSVTWGGIWNCIKDYDAYPVYLLGLTIMIPDQPPKTYLSFILSQLGFSTLQSNLLTIPSMALFMINALWMSRLVNRTRERSATAMITNVWMLPCLIALVTIPQTLNSKYWSWVRLGVAECTLRPITDYITMLLEYREGVEEESVAPKRVRGKNKVGGDLNALLELHKLRAQGIGPNGEFLQELATGAVTEAASLVRLSAVKPADVEWHPTQSVQCTSSLGDVNIYPLNLPDTSPLSLYVESEQVLLPAYTSRMLLNPRSTIRPIHLLDAAGHIYDMAWAYHRSWLAIAVSNERRPSSTFEESVRGGAIQIWSMQDRDEPQLLMILRNSAGTPCRLAWKAHGILAATYSDGSLSMIDVPNTDTPCEVDTTNSKCWRFENIHAYSLSWAGDRLAVGCTNGHILILNTETGETLIQAPVHDSLVSAISWQLLPPVDIEGNIQVKAQPTILLSVGLDGTEIVSDTNAMFTPFRLAHTREPRYAAAWASYGGLWVIDLGDNHFGSAIGTSRYHPFVATGAADGTVKLTNLLTAGKRKAEDGSRVMHKLFRLQYNQQTNSYTILHSFLPEGVWPQSASRSVPPSWDTWDPSIAVESLAFSPEPRNALMLASGMGVGLVRIESLS
ncbi:hypothetical protein MPSI1_003011 [Malassezia psittaci]|uniref:Anaphase-promoting complex subunit 4-like WD40 domain-containing protein n=1 Tax=Malassezia psittaci TaxID=1821823 RepID=A0AAF0F7Y6_9BASI|nr:hypothetical protein MPSI1_003011 [Malassezia psittaci]